MRAVPQNIELRNTMATGVGRGIRHTARWRSAGVTPEDPGIARKPARSKCVGWGCELSQMSLDEFLCKICDVHTRLA